MAKFVPKEKLSKKAQKELNRQRRVTWDFSPVTKTVDSRKLYNRKRIAQRRDDYGLGDSLFLLGISSFQRLLQSSSGGERRLGRSPGPLYPQQCDRNSCIPKL